MDNLYYNDIVTTLVIFIISLTLTSISSKMLKINLFINFLINFFVSICALYKFSTEKYNPSDSSFYYESGIRDVNFNFGTNFISYLSGFLSNQLNFEFFPIYFIFSIFCIFSIQIFYKIIFDIEKSPFDHMHLIRFIISLVVLISVGFWGAGINKEGITLLGVALFCFSIRKEVINKKQLFIAIALLLLSRPHIGIVAVFSILVATLFGKNAKKIDRLIISFASVIALGALVPLVLIYVGLNEFSAGSVSDYIDIKSEIYSNTSGYINIIDLSPPLRIASYLFRPFPWEASSILQLLSSALNIILLALIGYMCRSLFKIKFSVFNVEKISYTIFIAISLMVLSMTTSNLGISNRQKWMVVIPLLLLMSKRFIDKNSFISNIYPSILTGERSGMRLSHKLDNSINRMI